MAAHLERHSNLVYIPSPRIASRHGPSACAVVQATLAFPHSCERSALHLKVQREPSFRILSVKHRGRGIKDSRSRAAIFRTSSSLHSHSPRTRTLLGSTPLSGITNGVQALVHHLPRRSRYRRECCSSPDGVLRRHRRPRLGVLRVRPCRSLSSWDVVC